MAAENLVKALFRRPNPCLFAAVLVAAALLVLWSPAPAGTRSAQAAIPSGERADFFGDVDCSGTVDSADALALLRNAAGLSASAQCVETAGDTDCDGDRDAADIVGILRYVAGLPSVAPQSCTAVGERMPSSDDLIDAALTAGNISDEDATVYHLYAAFGDSRLPDGYRGAASGLPDSDAAMMAAVKFDSLSPDAQQKVLPFLTPPNAPGSWLEQSASASPHAANTYSWISVPAVNGRVKVSYPTLYPGWSGNAQAVADALTDTIWPALIGLMGEEHAPLSDADYPDNGGDGALDIYLVPLSDDGTLGVTMPYIKTPEGAEGPCEKSPAYIQIKGQEPLGSDTTPGILSTVAHELFHAFQFGFAFDTHCWFPEYRWFMEASATWAMDYVYPNANAEHEMAKELLDQPGVPLDENSVSHPYGAYLFPFYFTHQLNAPGLMRQIWESFAGQLSLPGIDSVLAPAGGIEALWPEFVRDNWNDPPIEQYDQWDGLTRGATFGFGAQVRLDGAEKKTYEVPADVDYLAARYPLFSFSYADMQGEPIRSVTFNNTLAGYPHANVQAIWYAGGDWHGPEDWTDESTKTFCRDEASTRVEEIVVMISNSDWQGKQKLNPATTPTLEASKTPCSRWVGEATMTYHRDDGFTVEDRTATAHDLVFEAAPAQGTAATTIKFALTKGTLDWTMSSTLGCTVTDSHTFDAMDGETGNLTVTAAGDHLAYSGYVSTRVAGSGECHGDSGSYSYSFSGDEIWFRTGPQQHVSNDLSHLAGEYSYSGGGASPFTYHYTWDLRAAPPEPSQN